jgi:hypothetical protein
MVTFWKPVSKSEDHLTPASRYKELGNGVYELWARCDLCARSNPFYEFALWEKGEDSSTICASCNSLANVERLLRVDGWKRC